MNKMRELRKQAGLTMKELGRIVGVSESTISLYERGQHEPDLVTLSRIAECLNTSVDYLLGRDDVPDTKKEPAPPGGMRESVMRLFDEIEAAGLSDAEAEYIRTQIEGIKALRKPG